jgi:hypothetical protein
MPDTLTIVGDRAFEYCQSLLVATLGDNITTIGDQAFNYCYSLYSVTLPESLSIIGSCAFGNTVVAEVVNKSSLELTEDILSYSFLHLTLKRVITDEIQSAIKVVGDYIFFDDGVEVCLLRYIGEATEITLPEYGHQANYSIGRFAFFRCQDITSITIPDCVTAIGGGAFEDCHALSTLKIPDSVTQIGPGAFFACYVLKAIKLPAQLTAIEDGMFDSCYALENITIPKSVTSIGYSAFIGCSALHTIAYEGTMAEWNKIEIDHYWNTLASITEIKCTDGTISLE